MKKGMCVTLDNGKEVVLIDSVNHKDCKYFAATSYGGDNTDLYFFRLLYDEEGKEFLEEIFEDRFSDVINALKSHLAQSAK